MKIFDGDISYRVKFSHIRTCFKLGYKMDDRTTPKYTKVRTMCEIFTGSSADDEILVGEGNSLVVKDEFSRLVGRYISFYRALSNMGLTSDTSPHTAHLRKILLTEFHKVNDRARARYICRSRGFELESVIEDYFNPKLRKLMSDDMFSHIRLDEDGYIQPIGRSLQETSFLF